MAGISRKQAIVIAEDVAVRDSLRFLLDTFGFVVKDYAVPAKCLAEHNALVSSHILVIYYRTCALGLNVVRAIRRKAVLTPVVILTTGVEAACRLEAARYDSVVIDTPPESEALHQAILAILG